MMRGRGGVLRSLGAGLVCIGLLHGNSLAGPMSMGGQLDVSATGAATYSIPIAVPPGTAGMEPKLALAYNSQGSNGLLGVGWGLSGLSAITRCRRTIAQDGVKGGVNYAANDRYCLDGQRLIAIAGTYGANNTEYRTERESFSKIVSYGSAGNGPARFEVRTKSGQIIEYGNTIDARIEAQGKSSVRIWAMNKVRDTEGNYFSVAYAEDTANGDFRPQSIAYTGNDVADRVLATNSTVQFTYETRPDIAPVWVGGSVVKTMKRLAKVQSFIGPSMVSEYRLTYVNGTAPNNASRLATVTQCSSATECLPATTFSWREATGTTGFPTQLTGFPFPTGPIGSRLPVCSGSICGQMASGDFNGDGRDDLAVTFPGNTSIYASYSNGASGSAPVVVGSNLAGPIYSTEWSILSTALVTVGDVNGDGKADIINGDGTVKLSTGSGFAAPVSWFPRPTGPIGVRQVCSENVCGQIVSADFNGDGKADLLLTTAGNTAIYVSYSNATGGTTPVAVGSNSAGPAYSSELGAVTSAFVTAGDVNGDGLADIIHGNGQVSRSTGTGFAAPVNWFALSIPLSVPLCNGILCGQMAAADVNGDGLADLVVTFPGNTAVYVSYSNGASGSALVAAGSNGAGLPMSVEQGNAVPSAFVAVGDFTGDGLADLISGFGAVSAATVPTPNRVSQVSNGIGATANITYKPTTDATVYTAESGAVYPIRDIVRQGPIYVVSALSSSNGIGGTLTRNYKYGGMKADVVSRGGLGFHWAEATDAGTGIVTRTEFRQDWPYVGLSAAVTKTLAGAGNQGRLSQTTYGYRCLNPQTGADGCVVAPGRRYFPYAQTSTASAWDLSGAALPVVTTTTNSIDGYGNATSVSVSTNDGYSKTTTNTYQNDTANWFLGRLLRSQVQSVTP